MSNNTLRIRTLIVDPKTLQDALQVSSASKGDTFEPLNGVQLVVDDIQKRPGMGASEVLISIAISVGTGVPVGVLANWIWSKLCQAGANPVLPPDSDVEAVTREDVEKLVTDMLSRNRESG